MGSGGDVLHRGRHWERIEGSPNTLKLRVVELRRPVANSFEALCSASVVLTMSMWSHEGTFLCMKSIC